MSELNGGNEAGQVWVRVCNLSQIPTDKAKGFAVNGVRLVITRCGDNANVLQGSCSHLLFPLANSKVDNCELTCALHHSKFAVSDGSVIDWSIYPPLVGQALAALRQRKALRSYKTRVTNGEVFISWPGAGIESVRVSFN